MSALNDIPTLTISDVSIWSAWIAVHYHDAQGVWLKLAKKSSGLPTVTHDQLLDIALCYGWIDGQRHGFDEQYYLQKFTPRRPRSLWSKRNIEKVEQLIADGRMQPGGLAQVESAKLDGRWQAAYDSPKNMTMPADFLAALESRPKAKAFYETLNKTNTFAIAFRLVTAQKPETRQRRFDALLAMLERGEKLH